MDAPPPPLRQPLRARARLPLMARVVAAVAAAVLLGAGIFTFTRGEEPPPARNESTLQLQPGGFRLLLSGDELAEWILKVARGNAAPLEDLSLDFHEEDGTVGFSARVRGVALPVRGRLAIASQAQQLTLSVLEARIGWFPIPDGGRSTIDELLNKAANLDEVLASHGVQVRSVTVTETHLVVQGVARDSAAVHLALQGALGGPGAREIPADLPRGISGERDIPGDPLYIAVGDSLGAGSHLPDLRDGYVWRVHRQLRERDSVEYGLANLSIPGATSGTLAQRQLTPALGIIAEHDVRYISVNIGGNDLLGVLRSASCSAGLDAPACRGQLATASALFQANLDHILSALRAAAPHARIVYLQPYNPFALGLDTTFERATNRDLQSFNAGAAAVAERHGVLVADGFDAMRGSREEIAALRLPADVHPRPLGHDRLALAVLAAVGAVDGGEGGLRQAQAAPLPPPATAPMPPPPLAPVTPPTTVP